MIPLVRAFATMRMPTPSVKPLNVASTCVPDVEAVEDKSSRAPVVVDVSMPVEDKRRSEPPLAITEVV